MVDIEIPEYIPKFIAGIVAVIFFIWIWWTGNSGTTKYIKTRRKIAAEEKE